MTAKKIPYPYLAFLVTMALYIDQKKIPTTNSDPTNHGNIQGADSSTFNVSEKSDAVKSIKTSKNFLIFPNPLFLTYQPF